MKFRGAGSQLCCVAAHVVLLTRPTGRGIPPPRGRNDPQGEGEAAVFEVALVAKDFAF